MTEGLGERKRRGPADPEARQAVTNLWNACFELGAHRRAMHGPDERYEELLRGAKDTAKIVEALIAARPALPTDSDDLPL